MFPVVHCTGGHILVLSFRLKMCLVSEFTELSIVHIQSRKETLHYPPYFLHSHLAKSFWVFRHKTSSLSLLLPPNANQCKYMPGELLNPESCSQFNLREDHSLHSRLLFWNTRLKQLTKMRCSLRLFCIFSKMSTMVPSSLPKILNGNVLN